MGVRRGALARLGMNRPNPDFWAGQRVLLTGHTGFKGAWTGLWLARLGAKVTGLALAPDQTPALADLAGYEHLAASHIVDLRDRRGVMDVVSGQPFDLVLHMAAQPIVRTAIEDPVEAFSTNIMGTVHLLEALRDEDALRAVLVITSDKVYANNDGGRAFQEGDALGGKDPYSASKACAEIVTASFARSYYDRAGVPVATARGGNVIGGGDFSRDRLVADIVRAARAGETTALRHPEATRPWQHVLDCVAGYLVFAQALVQRPDTPRALNFGPRPGAAEITVGDLATQAIAALDAKPWRHEADPNSIEARSLAVDAGLARKALEFESALDGPTAVAWTMDWYRRQGQGQAARDLCLAQIEAYESL